ncbi:hypothetical protein [Oceanobacillus kimchii]|uniref:Uncharacterized protein n=1 Tax=Oceanobacillus kimchii TaxID=746691 RepID=A0ABQ5TFX8_9BACI|nr:hypothetical protein [Oceanobacillus kimchii]GLO65781.1 hypothetical protein MACH08_15650 [Oceanobacillus kimchii]
MKLVPIYTLSIKNGTNYTIFLEQGSHLVYKAYHREPGQKMYWLAFFTATILLRIIQEFTIDIPIIYLIAIFMIGGYFMGRWILKKFAYKEMVQIYITPSMIEDYIEKGRKGFILEKRIIFFIFLLFLLLMFIFIISHLFNYLLISFFLYVILIILLHRFPIARFKLYK